MDLDLNRLNGISFAPVRPATLQFTVAANSFFTILVFNDLLRGPDSGSMALMPSSQAVSGLPVSLAGSLNQLVIEKLASSEGFDLAVRDGKTGFTFFNVEGGQYDYDANAKLFSITEGRLLVSKEFAESLGRSADAGAGAGEISIGATMQPIETMQLDAKRRCEIRDAAPASAAVAWDCSRPRRHHWRAHRSTAIDQWCSKWPRGDLFGNRCLQQRDG